MNNIYWSTASIIFYVMLALLGMFCMSKLKDESRQTTFKNLFLNPHFLLWWGAWTIIATWRLVTYGIGGMDAIGYVHTFENSLTPNLLDDHSTSDLLFFEIVRTIRRFTSDYHIYFLCIYGSMLAMYIYFLKHFSESRYSVVPYFLTFYLYLRSFNTLRSNFAIAIILMSLVAFSEKEYRKAYLFAIASVLIHKAAAVYALVLPFVHFFTKRRINYYYLVVFVVISAVGARIFQSWFLNFVADVDLGGAYKSYASSSLEGNHSFMYVDSFGQWLLAFLLWKYKNMFSRESVSNPKVRILWLAAVFDITMVPFSSILGIWRAYEFLYLSRLILLGLILSFVLKSKSNSIKILVRSMVFLFLLMWMIYRISRTYEDSALMPYIFEPFI